MSQFSNKKKEFKEESVDSIAFEKPVLKETFTHEELHRALLFAEDMLERALIKFMVLGETARQLKSTDLPQFDLNFIHLGILESELTKSGLETLKVTLKRHNNFKYNESKKEITFEHNGVPIVIDLLDRQLPYFRNPDSRFYYDTQFKIPNPFDVYWDERELIR